MDISKAGEGTGWIVYEYSESCNCGKLFSVNGFQADCMDCFCHFGILGIQAFSEAGMACCFGSFFS